MEREQIVKALECCTRGRKSKEDRPCLECPYNECNIVGGTSERQILGTCQGWLMKDALSLIKKLTKEVEDLKAIAEQYQKQFEDCYEEKAKLTEENERLHASCTELTQNLHECKADTVRKMQERLIAEFRKDDRMNYYLRKTLDQIAKEMEEGKG